MNGSSKPSWRKKGRSSGRRREPAREQASDWQRRRVDHEKTAGFRRRLKLLGLLAATAALTIWFIWIWLQFGKITPVISFTVTSYTTPIAPNAYAREDMDRLAEARNERVKVLRDELEGRIDGEACLKRLQEKLDWKKQTAQKPGGPSKDLLIVYLSAHGVVNGKSQPCLLFSDAKPLDCKTWLPVAKLLSPLKQLQVEYEKEHGPGSRKILLVLDSGRIGDDWSLGILHNAFAENLERAVREASVPGLYVLNAAGPGQIAWPAPELDGTAFGYFFAEGISGGAKGSDSKITLRELHKYLLDQVGRWTLSNRADIQQPTLIPELAEEKDFAIAFAGAKSSLRPSKELVAERQTGLSELQKELDQSWQRYDSLVNERELYRTDPVGLAVLQHKLLRARQLLLAGKDYRNEFTETLGNIKYLLQKVGRTQLPQGLAGYSLPLAMQLKAVPETAQQRNDVVRAWEAAGGKPEPKEGEPEPAPLSYLASADIGWSWLATQSGPSRDRMREVIGYVAGGTGRPTEDRSHADVVAGHRSADVLEIQFLKMLERYLDWPANTSEVEDPLREAFGHAISTRRKTEQAAAPADERAHYWIQPLVDAIDQRRRIAEDLLFVGNALSLADANSGWSELTGDGGKCEVALRQSDTVSRYLALRDRAWAELPYLAQWLLRQLQVGRLVETGYDPAALTDTLLLQVIRRTHDLGDQLDQGLFDLGDELPPELVEASDDVTALHAELKDAYLQYCDYLQRTAGRDRPTLHGIGFVLKTPLLDSDRREKLAAKYLEILFLESGFGQTDGEDENVDLDDVSAEVAAFRTRATGYVERVGQWSRHPALEVLDRSKLNLLSEPRREVGTSKATGESDVAWLSRQGGQVRELLTDILSVSNDLESVTDERLEKADETAANARAGLSQADRLSRASAPLLTTRTWEDPERDPAHRLRLVDWHFLMLWHSRRMLDDFWGSPTDSRVSSYFAIAASGYLKSARILNDTPRSLRHGREDLDVLLERRQQAAQSISVKSPDVRTLGEKSTTPHEVKVDWPGDIPPGTAAVYLQSPDDSVRPGRLIPVMDEPGGMTVRRRGKTTAGESPEASVRHQIILDELDWATDHAELDATAFFRGHLRRAEFQVRGPTYVTEIEVERRTDSAAEITVWGEGDRPGHIMFVFDCSGSMKDTGAAGRRKIDVAKAALESVLTKLDEQVQAKARYWVGLRAYGRRSKYVEGTSRTWEDYVANPTIDEDADVPPDVDVEELFPLTKFEHKEMVRNAYLRKLHDKLRELVPCGQTPLYYALKLSLDDFAIAKPNEPKHIVVITDGINQVTDFAKELPHIVDRRNALTSKEEVLTKWRQKEQQGGVPPRIHLIGLDMKIEVDVTAKEKELKDKLKLARSDTEREKLEEQLLDLAKVRELQDLAVRSGGQCYDATDVDTLMTAVRKALRLGEFSVSGPGGEAAGVERMDLGSSWLIPDVPPSPTPYVVQLHGVDRAPNAIVQLEGGEAAELVYDSMNNQLVYPRYLPQSHDLGDAGRGPTHNVTDPLGSGQYVVQAMLPKRSGNDIQFFVYAQHKDPLTFTTRPKHVWAEIRPAGPSSDRVYRFFDPDFVPDRPVPVFRFVTHDWPTEAEYAEIKLWFQFESANIKPDWRGEVDPLRTSEIKLDALQNVSFEARSESIGADGYRVVVLERHPIDGALAPAKLQSHPLPDRILHKTFAGVNVVKHQFDYARQTPAAIEITARDTITSEAIAVPTLRVKVEE